MTRTPSTSNDSTIIENQLAGLRRMAKDAMDTSYLNALMENLETMAILKPGDGPAKLILSDAMLNDPNAVLRLLVKDHSMSQEGEHA